MRAAAREAIAPTCARAGAVLVADETCAELRLDGPALPPPLGAFDAGGTVVTVGSMSKSAWGGLRIGWVRATARAIRELAAVRSAVDMAGPVLEQLVAVELLTDWDAVLASRRALLRPRRAALFAALAEHAPSWAVRRPTRRHQRLGAPPDARRDPPRRRRRRPTASCSPPARRSRSTAPSSTTSACRSRCRRNDRRDVATLARARRGADRRRAGARAPREVALAV